MFKVIVWSFFSLGLSFLAFLIGIYVGYLGRKPDKW